MPLSERDKTKAPSGYGYHFHHTTPQRRVPCVLGDMLAPKSADDIPPITPGAMASVQAALKLLADLVGDRDLGMFLGDSDAKLAEHREHARIISNAARGLAGILRVENVQAMGGVGGGGVQYAVGISSGFLAINGGGIGETSAEADHLELRAQLRAEREKSKQLEEQVKQLTLQDQRPSISDL